MNVKTWFCVIGVAAGLSLASTGCGDGKKSPKNAARDAGDTAASLNSLKSDPEDRDSLRNVLQLYADAQAIAALGVVPPDEDSMSDMDFGQFMRAFTTNDNCVSGSNPYTYTDCVIDPTTFSGTLSTSGDIMSFSLIFDIDPKKVSGMVNDAFNDAGASNMFKIKIDRVQVEEQAANLTVKDTLVDGDIHIIA